MEQYNSIQQLLKKEGGKKNPVFPPTVVQAVFDAKTGASLEAILAQFNSVYLQYQGTPQATRLIIPKEMRRAGLTITYMNMDSETITERAASAVQKDNDHWGLDINWSRVDELTLSGDISVSAQGTWIINGSDTGVKAVGPKGDAGITPWLKTIDNRLHVSYDNVNWEPCSEPISAYFRWSSNKIQISRDNKTWTDLSGTFADNVHIKGYVATTSALPSGAAQGDIYGVGPTYAAEDTAHTNPIYRLYVRNDNTWVDNGSFTSIAAGIVQEPGDSENLVMSQKAVSAKLSELGSEVVKIQSIKRNDRFYITKGGNVGYNEGFDFALSDYFVVSENVVINKCKPTGNAPYLVGCLYDEDMNYIGDVTSDKNSVHNISLSDIEVPTNAKYMRANLLVGEGNVQGTSFDYISSLFDVIGSRPTKKEFSNLTSKVDENVFGVYVERFKYIGIYDGLPTIRETNSTDFSVTPYLRIKELSDFSITCKPSSDLSFAGLYDSEFNPIAYISHTGTSNVNYSLDMLKNEIANQNLTDTSVFVVFCVAYSKTNEGKLQISKRADVGLSKKVGELEEGLKKAEEEIKSNLYGIEVNRYSYIRSIDGLPKMYSTTASEFSTTNYLKIKELNDFSIVCKPYGASPYTFAGLYDKDFNPIGCINFTNTGNVGGYTLSKLTNDLELQGLSDTACYVIFNIAYSYTNDGVIEIARKAELKKSEDWWSNTDIYNYDKVLSMPKDVVKAMVETASNGRCTALYDAEGYPSLMYKLPIVSIGALERKLGDFNTPHPAFIVNGVQKKCIYMSVFMSSSYNGHLVSWFGLSPVASLNITQLRSSFQSKGEGWHLETIYERSLLSLLARKFNSPNPKCNNYWGRSRNDEDAYMCAEMVNGGLTGQGLQSNGAKWINGSQPSEWSHNKQLWGIQDVCGGYHEIVDCVKVVDGFIYLCSDNGYNASEETWINTGIAYDYIGGELALNTRITSRTPSESTYVKKDIEDVVLTSEYDLLSEDVRKKMVMLFISPKLKSNEEGLTLGTNGDVGVNNNVGVTGYMVMGGAEEYANCGYNYNVNSYDLSVITAHNNMGSRIVYIEP